MSFSYEDYYRTAFVIPIIILIFVFLITVENILVFTNVIQFKKILKIINIVFNSIIILLFSVISICSLSRSYSLAKEKKIDFIITQGVVQNITNMPFAEKYFVNGKATYSQYIQIDDIKYYCMSADNVKVGTLIEIQYLPTSKFILEIKSIEE